MEANKTKHDMAEYDLTFIDRMMEMYDEELLAYLHSLTPDERKAVEAAIFREMSQRAVQNHLSDLQSGLTN